MDSSASISRAQLVYGLCLPLAALVGFFLADPLRFSSLAVLGCIGLVLLWPMFLKWYHPLLVGCLQSSLFLGFLPGAVPIWYPVVFVAFGVVVLNRCLDARVRLVPEGSEGVVWSLAAIGLVVLITGALRGSAGLAALGGTSSGGKKYIGIFLSMMVFFVLASRSVPPKRTTLYLGLMCAAVFTGLLSHLALMTNQFWMFKLVDPGPAIGQAMAAWDVQGRTIFRSLALMRCMAAIIFFMAAYYGAAGLLNVKRPWRLAVVLACLGVGMLGGFRIFLAEVGILLGTLFILEGLHRTRYLALVAALLVGAGLLAIVFVDELPRSVQRTLSFLPIKVDPGVKQDAVGSLDWRLEMWGLLRQEVPNYLALGKGFGIDRSALAFSDFNAQFGFGMQAEWAVLTGEYHNGPLSVIIPLGVWGVAAFIWLLVAIFLRLRWFCMHGDPAVSRVNRVLLAAFVTRVVVFIFLFGSFSSQLVEFLFLAGFAEAINRGAKPAAADSAAGDTEWPEEVRS